MCWLISLFTLINLLLKNVIILQEEKSFFGYSLEWKVSTWRNLITNLIFTFNILKLIEVKLCTYILEWKRTLELGYNEKFTQMLTFNILVYQYLDDHFYKLICFWFKIILFKINLTLFYSYYNFFMKIRGLLILFVEWC